MLLSSLSTAFNIIRKLLEFYTLTFAFMIITRQILLLLTQKVKMEFKYVKDYLKLNYTLLTSEDNSEYCII